MRVSLRLSRMQRLALLPFRSLVRPHPKALDGSFSKTSHSRSYIDLTPMASPSLRSRITRVGRVIGNRVFKTANQRLQATRTKQRAPEACRCHTFLR